MQKPITSTGQEHVTGETREIGLSDIVVLPDRMRALRQDVVDELAASMKLPQGLLQPILLRPREGNGYYLVAGKHRYFAAQQLGWEAIRSTIAQGMDADRALLAEIDENLVRANLTPAEEAAHHAARKEVYERLYPQTKKGGAPGAGRGKKKRSEERQNGAYTKDAGKKTGKSRRSVERATKRGKDIPNVGDLAGTSLDKGDELDALAALGKESPEEQQQLIDQAKAGEEVSARTALKQRRPRRSEAEIVADQLEHLGVVIARISGMGTSLEHVQVPRLPPKLAKQYLEELNEAMHGFRQFRDRVKEAGHPSGSPGCPRCKGEGIVTVPLKNKKARIPCDCQNPRPRMGHPGAQQEKQEGENASNASA
jgi:ParB family chromosome partitioning protein